jgi:hypothetical protein
MRIERIRSVAAAALVAAGALAAPRSAGAYCRTTTCPLPPNWSPDEGCYPPDFATYCAGLMPPAKVLPLWWANACISFDLQQNASRWISYQAADDLLNAAFAKWTQSTCGGGSQHVSISVTDLGPVVCGEVNYNKDGSPNQHVVVFRDDVWPHNDPFNALGLTTVTFDTDTGEIYDADTEINGTLSLSVGASMPGSYDLDSILTHEMGHFLGLAHSSDTAATMFASYTPGSTSMRMLSPDDTAGLCSIYPPGGTRNVDPSVSSGGSVKESACDPTPRHGFSSECHAPPLPSQTKRGCAVAGGVGAGAAKGGLLFFVAASTLAFARRRFNRRGAGSRSAPSS